MLRELKRAAGASILETQPHYRTAIGVLGVLLPVMLILSSLFGRQSIRNSISAYYHTSARDWFVGTLWVLGVFLFFYRYRPRHERTPRSDRKSIQTGEADAWLGKIAGMSAILVALLPTTDGSATQPVHIGRAHGIAAALLFTSLSLFPLLLFSQSRKRSRFYRAVGWTMIALMVLIAAYQFSPENLQRGVASLRPVLVLEALLVWAFGISWFEKGRELAGADSLLRTKLPEHIDDHPAAIPLRDVQVVDPA